MNYTVPHRKEMIPARLLIIEILRVIDVTIQIWLCRTSFTPETLYEVAHLT